MTYFDMFNLAVSVIVFLLTGWVVVNLVHRHKSWFLIAFFFVFTEASVVAVLANFVAMPEWIWLVRVINSLIFIGSFVGLIYESSQNKNDL